MPSRVILTALRIERAKFEHDARDDGRADRPSLSGGDREPDDFDMGGGVPSWTVEDGRLVRLNPPQHWNVIEGEHFATDYGTTDYRNDYGTPFTTDRDPGDETPT